MNLVGILAVMAALTGVKTDRHKPIAEAIYNNCQPKHHLLITVIAFKESSYRRGIFRENSNGTYDGGVFQINSIHGLKSKDKMNLNKSAHYACKLLERHEQHAATDKAWFARYHSATPSLKQKYYLEIWVLLLTNRRIKK